VTELSEVLSGVRHLAIDTAPFIYLVESHSQFAPVIRSVVRRAEQGELSLVSSVLTLTEVLTRPFAEGAHDLVDSYRELLLGSPHLQIWAVDTTVAETAARLRADYRLKTPDALQIAVAHEAGCEAFLTNDDRLKRVEEPRILVLSTLTP